METFGRLKCLTLIASLAVLLAGCIFGADPGGLEDSVSSPDGATPGDATTGDAATTCRLDAQANDCVCASGNRGSYVEDRDGDGYPDPDGAERVLCGPKSGWASRDKPTDCMPDNARSHPDTQLDDGWLCNGEDDDCDGNRDEVCCTRSSPPANSIVHFEGSTQMHPAIVEAPEAEATPEGGSYLHAWAVESTLSLQLVDRRGRVVEEMSEEFEHRIVDLAVARTASGYVAVVSTRDEYEPTNPNESPVSGTSSALYNLELSADLSESTRVRLFSSNGEDNGSQDHEAHRYRGLALAASGDRRLVVYNRTSFIHGVSTGTNGARREHQLHAYAYRGSAPGGNGKSFELAPNASANPYLPSALVQGDRFVAARWRPDDKKIRVSEWKFAPEGTVQEAREADVPIPADGTSSRQVGLAHAGGDTFLVVTAADVDEGTTLQGARVSFGETAGLAAGPAAMAADDNSPWAPRLTSADTDGDGELDRTIGVWMRQSGSSVELVTASTTIEGLSEFSDRTVISTKGNGRMSLAAGSRAAAVSWQYASATGNFEARFAPLSLTGTPICL